MFYFGLFSTHIPYVILSAAYMLYFGLYALSKTDSLISMGQPESAEQVIVTQVEPLKRVDCYHYDDHFSYHQPDETSELPCFSFLSIRKSVYPHRSEKALYTGFGYSQFSRPPPVIS